MTPPKISPALTFLVEYLDLEAATGIPGATWEAFQLRHLNNLSMLAISDKSRQVGWSWLAAAEAVAYACIEKRLPNIFVSINLEEAGEKIRYAGQIREALDKEVRPSLITNNRLELEFDNGSRLLSHPSRPVRGKARARVYLDEFAHYVKDREIYQSAVPVISKGGVIRIGSSPLGASGLFWEIFSQTLRPYPGYVRDSIPWWQIRALCKDVRVATRYAPKMLTDQRVHTFGSQRLIEIFENVILEDFQQEYECSWVDESVAWISWDLIKRNYFPVDADGNSLIAHWHAKSPDAAMAVIDEIAIAIQEQRIEPALTGGMDIGRKHDLSEITLIGKSSAGTLPYRLGVSLDRCEFDVQEAVLGRIMDRLPVTWMLIDQNGLGMQLAEHAQAKFGVRAQGVDFTNESKALWATEMKIRFERTQIPIPPDRDLVYQIHSVKKKITQAKNVVFDVEASEKHHADKFWSLALAVWGAKDLSQANEWIAAIQRRTGEQT